MKNMCLSINLIFFSDKCVSSGVGGIWQGVSDTLIVHTLTLSDQVMITAGKCLLF